MNYFFFFSSRRRHTRLQGDWSSDVCSSDLVPALKGPRGTGWASEHVMGIYVIWKFAQSPDVAKQFLLDLIGHYRDAVLGSKLYNFPSFPGSVADLGVAVAQKPAGGNKWLEQATANDPFGS